MLSLSQSPQRSRLLKLLIVVFLLAIALFNVAPNYLTGGWSWNETPKVPHLRQLRQVRTEGLVVPGWKTDSKTVIDISGHEWLAQTITPNTPETQALSQTSVILLLRPQNWYRDLPQVEWMDINGAQQWNADSIRQLEFTATIPNRTPAAQPSNGEATLTPNSASIRARFLRGWTKEHTFAVLQWYAWLNGGSDAPSTWFWADQRSQWSQRQKTSWVAVSVLIPMKPLGDISSVQPLAEALGKTLQATLMTDVFTSSSP